MTLTSTRQDTELDRVRIRFAPRTYSLDGLGILLTGNLASLLLITDISTLQGISTGEIAAEVLVSEHDDLIG